jgi:hypothetical protein
VVGGVIALGSLVAPPFCPRMRGSRRLGGEQPGCVNLLQTVVDISIYRKVNVSSCQLLPVSLCGASVSVVGGEGHAGWFPFGVALDESAGSEALSVELRSSGGAVGPVCPGPWFHRRQSVPSSAHSGRRVTTLHWPSRRPRMREVRLLMSHFSIPTTPQLTWA